MAFRQLSRLFINANRGIFTSSRLNVLSSPEDFPPPSKIETGLEKIETAAIQSGNEDPFNMDVIKRGPGTKDKPTLIPSAFGSRMVGCICEEDAIHINWMWLYSGKPKRCGQCGHWYQLTYKPPIH